MPVKITIERDGGTVAKIETARADIAAQLVYDVAETVLDDELSDLANQSEALDSLLEEMFGPDDDDLCDCPPGTCLAQEEADAQAEQQVDPNSYQNGLNGLSISDSAQRAASQVAEILNRESSVDGADFDRIIETSQRAISVGIARNTLYRFAGEIARHYREDGLYKGIPLANVFQIKVDKEILAPEYS